MSAALNELADDGQQAAVRDRLERADRVSHRKLIVTELHTLSSKEGDDTTVDSEMDAADLTGSHCLNSLLILQIASR